MVFVHKNKAMQRVHLSQETWYKSICCCCQEFYWQKTKNTFKHTNWDMKTSEKKCLNVKNYHQKFITWTSFCPSVPQNMVHRVIKYTPRSFCILTFQVNLPKHDKYSEELNCKVMSQRQILHGNFWHWDITGSLCYKL